jgi:uncharacterized protein (DUF1015 family)
VARGAPLVLPFRALRPRPDTARDVVAPPYDVVDADEARALAADWPASFLHISRPEIDFAPGVDAHAEPVYARGAENLARLVASGVLEREQAPCYYVYRMTMGARTQTGIGLVASVEAYEQGRVRRHELTRQDKEDDRVRNIDTLGAQTGPVLAAYRANAGIAALLADAAHRAPFIETEGPNAVLHTLWRIDEAGAVAALSSALNGLDALYIADGHHRSAAAARVAATRRAAAAAPTGRESYEYFLTVAFADDELEILDYNRVVADLGGLSAAALVARVAERFDLAAADAAAKPAQRGELGMYVAGRWYRLTSRSRPADPVEALDVSILQRELVEPILGISDPRDARIDFIGGIRGLSALEARVDSGRAAVAFALHPTSMHELMAVADAGRLMPPKSTWFEPKLADGLLSHVLD